MRFLKKFLWTVATVGLGTAGFAFIPGLRTTLPGRVVRGCLGEPGTTQWVNDTADRLSSADMSKELEELAERLISEFGSMASTLPEEPFGQGRLLPIDRLPPTFRKMGGSFGDPEMVMRSVDSAGSPALVLSWGHMRQAIFVSTVPVTSPPLGFATRRVNDRIYVVAEEL